MEEYLKKRFTSYLLTFAIVAVIVLSAFTFILYKQQALEGLWGLLISLPIMIGAFAFGVWTWNKKLRNLAGTEFILTDNSLVQRSPNQTEKDFNLNEIAVVDKKKFGTTIIKGDWLAKVDYYRPKKSSYHLDDPKLIFIPSITTNYVELIETIKRSRRQT